MTSRLAWAVLTTSFASGTRRPRTTATLRLAASFIAAIFLGLNLAGSLRRSGLPTNLPADWLGALVMTSGFVLFGLILLSIGAALSRTDALARLISTLPLPASTRRLVALIPPAIILAVTLAFATPVVMVLELPFGPAYFLAGAGAALALVLAPGHAPALKALVFAVFTGTAIWLLTRSQPAAVYYLLSLPFLSLASRGHVRPSARPHRRLIQLPERSLPRWWFVLKLVRNRRSQLALSFSLALSVITATTIAWRDLGAMAGAGWLIMSAVLTAAVACDVRGLSPRHKAPEVEALGGLRYFLASQTRAAILIAILPPLPLIAALLPHVPAAELLTYGLALQAAALMLGLLAGAIFVPRDGDTGAQFFAATLSTSALFALPKLTGFQSQPLSHHAVAWLAVALTALALIPLIETFRRHRYATI